VSAYLLLFATALAAATVLPFYSEFLLLSQLEAGLDPWWLWLSASTGNTLGAVINWWLGATLAHYAGRRWFPASPAQLARAQRWFQRYGSWTLLLSWLPLGGDALTVVGGMMRVRFGLFLLLVAIGKSARYGALVLGYKAL
jgi:membrane protein YqaA with SNARE-associated domain